MASCQKKIKIENRVRQGDPHMDQKESQRHLRHDSTWMNERVQNGWLKEFKASIQIVGFYRK